MFSYRGIHMADFDFPTLPEKKNKYSSTTNKDLQLNFGDILYQVPEMVMHYLDDAEAIGWTWMPPQDFIDRVMKGGLIKFTKSTKEWATLNLECIGYLRKGSGEFKDQIVDTKGGDINYDNAKPVKLGKAPAEFIDRMKKILAAAWEHENNPKTHVAAVMLPVANGYEKIVIPKAAAKQLSYEQQFNKIRAIEEENGIQYNYDIYQVAEGLQFFALNNNAAIANVDLIYDQIYRWNRGVKENNYAMLSKRVSEIFSYLDIQFDRDETFPLLKISGRNLEKLKALGAKILDIKAEPTLAEKVAAVFGYYPEKTKVSTETIQESVYERDEKAIRDFLEIKENKDINLLTLPAQQYLQLTNKYGKIERIVFDKDKMKIESKAHVVEFTFPSLFGAHAVQAFIDTHLIKDGQGIWHRGMRSSSDGWIEISHYPSLKDRCGPLDKEFLALLDKEYAKSFIHKLKAKYKAIESPEKKMDVLPADNIQLVKNGLFSAGHSGVNALLEHKGSKPTYVIPPGGLVVKEDDTHMEENKNSGAPGGPSLI